MNRTLPPKDGIECLAAVFEVSVDEVSSSQWGRALLETEEKGGASRREFEVMVADIIKKVFKEFTQAD